VYKIIVEPENGFFMISPQSEAENSTFLIQADTQEQAETISFQLGNGTLQSPLNKKNGQFQLDRISGETPVFILQTQN
jgi:hypothetical protein